MNDELIKVECELCGDVVANFNIIHMSSEGKTIKTCLRCFNKAVSENNGSDFEHVEFDPVIMKDTDNNEHKFYFIVRNLGDRVGIDSFEIKDGHRGGYKFSVIDDIETELLELFERLFKRMKRALSKKHMNWDTPTNKDRSWFRYAPHDLSLFVIRSL